LIILGSRFRQKHTRNLPAAVVDDLRFLIDDYRLPLFNGFESILNFRRFSLSIIDLLFSFLFNLQSSFFNRQS